MIAALNNNLNDQIKSNMYETMLMLQQRDQPPPSLVLTDTESNASNGINSISSASTVATLLSSIKSLEEELQHLKLVQVSQQTAGKTINPRTGKKWKRYCWSCGCCPHSSKYCPNKLPGHRDDASFKNRLGGSNKDCRPVQE